jgi:hypothetical protein
VHRVSANRGQVILEKARLPVIYREGDYYMKNEISLIPLPAKLGRTAGRDRAWNKALRRYDERAYGDLKAALPMAVLTAVEGNYVHEPRLKAVLPRSMKNAEVVAILRAAGWKRRNNKWSLMPVHSRCFQKDGQEINVEDYAEAAGREVRMYTHYPMSFAPVPPAKGSPDWLKL